MTNTTTKCECGRDAHDCVALGRESTVHADYDGAPADVWGDRLSRALALEPIEVRVPNEPVPYVLRQADCVAGECSEGDFIDVFYGVGMLAEHVTRVGGLSAAVNEVLLDAGKRLARRLKADLLETVQLHAGELLERPQPTGPLQVGERAIYRGAWGSGPGVAVRITGEGEKNGRRVLDADNGHWGYESQFTRIVHPRLSDR